MSGRPDAYDRKREPGIGERSDGGPYHEKRMETMGMETRRTETMDAGIGAALYPAFPTDNGLF